MAVSGVTQLQNLIPEIWSATFYDELRSNLNIGSFFLKTYDKDFSLGDTVNVSQIAAFTGETLTDDTAAFNPELMSVSSIPIVVNKRASASVEISDLAKLQSISFEEEMKKALIYAVSKQIEDAMITALVPSAAAPDHQIAPASAGVLAVTDVATIRALLSTQKVSIQDTALFLAPTYYVDLMNATTAVNNQYIPNGSPMSSGRFSAPIMGFEVVEANNLGTDIGYACHKSAAALVMQQNVRVQISNQHVNNKYSYLVSADVVFGIKLLDNKRLVKING